MSDEDVLRLSVHGMQKALPQPQWLAVCWAINEIDDLRRRLDNAKRITDEIAVMLKEPK